MAKLNKKDVLKTIISSAKLYKKNLEDLVATDSE